jgi:hypothetical protein
VKAVVRNIVRSVIVSAAAGLLLEFVWAASNSDVTQYEFLFSWRRAFIFGQLAFVIALLWTAWGLIDVESRIHFANAFPWLQLIRNYRVSKPVATAWPMLLIVLYIAVGVKHLKTVPGSVGDVVRWINTEAVTFDFLGQNFRAEDIFRIEFAGYVAGLIGFFIARSAAPYWCRVRADEEKSEMRNAGQRPKEPRALLAETIARDGTQIPSRDLVLSLEDVCQELAGRYPNHDWRPVKVDLRKAQQSVDRRLDPEARQAAVSVVKALPDDDTEPEAISRELFDNTRPQLRVGLGAWLLFAYLLVGLPIVARAAVLLFPLLEESPSKW